MIFEVLEEFSQKRSSLAFDFIKIVGMGALIGAGVGLAVSQVIKQVDDPMIEITLIQGFSDPLARAVLDQEIDFAVVLEPPKHEAIEITRLADDTMVLISSPALGLGPCRAASAAASSTPRASVPARRRCGV